MLFIIGVFTAFIFARPGDYNANEEKALAQHPRIYEANSFDEYCSSFDSYTSDQFPFRTKIIKGNNEVKTQTQVDTIVEDVYVLSSDYLFGITYETLDSDAEALTRAIKERRNKTKLPFVYIIVPQKNLILGDSEPNVTTVIDEKNLQRITDYFSKSRISFIDCCKYMQSFDLEERSKFFYKTDMHWNEYGAFIASEHVADQLAETHRINHSSVPKDSDFIWSDLTGLNYLGDFQKRFSSEVTVKEYIPFYVASNAQNFKYYTELDGNEVPRESIVASGIDSDPLDYNKLSTYNHGYLRVENSSAAEDKRVLMLKDSYECCMTDYFSELFAEINIVDPRYSDCPSFEEISQQRNIDLVLMIYHSNNISKELSDYLSIE